MKRSEINDILREDIKLCKRLRFKLPPWAYWTPKQWLRAGPEYDEIRDCKLGWDITDYGKDKFTEVGLSLFTIRNGHPHLEKYPKTYCEKLLIVRENQHTPYHFHWAKSEDIICRGGGNLICEVYNSTPEGALDEANEVPVFVDGCHLTVKPGSRLRLKPGESVTLCNYNYHEFWAEEGTGTSLLGEVSMVNDDENDNRYLAEVGRFPTIEEDEAPLHLLCNEYPRALPAWALQRLSGCLGGVSAPRTVDVLE